MREGDAEAEEEGDWKAAGRTEDPGRGVTEGGEEEEEVVSVVEVDLV